MLLTERNEQQMRNVVTRRQHRMRYVLPAVLMISALSIAACGDAAQQTEQTTTGAQTGQPTTAAANPTSSSVRAFQLLDERHGWIARGDTVAFTADGGQSFRSLNLPKGTTAVVFFDAERVIATTADVSTQRATLWFSEDSGATFTERTEIPAGTPVVGLSGDVTSDGSLRLLVRFGSGSSFNFGKLFASQDGMSWTEIPGAPSGGEVRFADPSHGVILGGPLMREAWATSDGGTTWQELNILPPPTAGSAFPAAVIAKSSKSILLGTSNSEGDSAFAVAVWTVTDTQATKSASASSNADGQVLALTPSGRLLVIGSAAIDSVDRTSTVQHETPTNLGAGVTAAQFASDSVGWALRQSAACKEKKDCAAVSQVVVTRDGGRSWTTLGA